MNGLSGVVDGDHYFDTVAEDAMFEFLYEFPGWPRTIRGRAELMTATPDRATASDPVQPTSLSFIMPTTAEL